MRIIHFVEECRDGSAKKTHKLCLGMALCEEEGINRQGYYVWVFSRNYRCI